MLVDGNCHCFRLLVVSVRYHPPRLTVVFPALNSSIQSEKSPFSSASVRLLLAMNSVMTTLSCAKRAAAGCNKNETIRSVRRYSFICSVIGQLAGISEPVISQGRLEGYNFTEEKPKKSFYGFRQG